MVGAGYSIRSGGNNAALIRKKGSARQAITYFQGELECRHGIPAENHRRFLKRVRDANEKENPKVSLQAEKQLMELDGHIGTAKSQRSGNVSINISGLMPGSISIEQGPIEGAVVPGPNDDKV
ncbi:MAG: hypothetical protein GY918_07625 [Gammaproteobacteria bacterium]|nr:hypothetical protein [Gammaproteobacteria bacterium]